MDEQSNKLQTLLDKILEDKNTNLTPDNLREGTICLGIEGKLQEGIDESDATATVNDILKDKTAYSQNKKITGTIETYDGTYEGNAIEDELKITDASYLFYRGARTDYLKEFLELCDKVTNMQYMFAYCNKLTNLNLNSFNMSKVDNIINIFYSSSQLTNLQFGSNLGKGYTQKSTNYSSYKLDLSSCKLLTHESLMNVINNLYDLNLTYDVANGGTLYTQSLVLGSTNLAKLTEEEIAIATNKGWNVT